MSRMGQIETAISRARQAILLAVMAVTATGFTARAAVADLLPEDQPSTAPDLAPAQQRKADALAWYMTGLFEEESEGPEKALASKRKSLALDPANSPLAIEIAYDYLRRGETAEAISILKDSVKAAPKDPGPCLALSSIYLKHLQKPELAVKYAQAALDANPTDFTPYGLLWEIYQAQGQQTKAGALLDKAAKSKSTDPRFWLSLAELSGRTYFQVGRTISDADIDKVAPLLEKAASLGEKDADVQVKIGDIFLVARRFDKAIPYFEKAASMKPGLPKLREKLAGSYIETGKNEEAAAILDEIVKLNPLNLAAYDQLTALHIRAGNLERAAAAAQQAIIMEPNVRERYEYLAEMYFKLKNVERAASTLAEGVRRFPRAGRLSYFHALALSDLKKHDEAMKAFEKALVEAGNNQPELLNAEFYFSYGAASEQAKNYVKAAELFKKSIELEPASAARAYNYLGYMWVELNQNLDEAGQLIKQALDMEPGNGAYLDSLGWLYFKQGKYEDALTQLLRAAEALPEPDAVVFSHIGDTYEKLGKKAEAVLYWQKALQLDPENKELSGKLDKATEKVAQQPKPVKASVNSQTPVPQSQE